VFDVLKPGNPVIQSTYPSQHLLEHHLDSIQLWTIATKAPLT